MIHGMDGKPYDFAGDKLGEIVWRTFSDRIISQYPYSIKKPVINDAKSTIHIVDSIIRQFKYLIEDRDIWRELYTDTGQPRLEKAVQRMFYMTALSYCEANNLNITPEADTGRGPVDFKFSTGISDRVLVELKLSRNPKALHGFTRQLDIYNSAERPVSSKYIIIDVGGIKTKLNKLELPDSCRYQLMGQHLT
jgi:hypothetical protein